MLIMDFNDSPKMAFLNGFLKGMAAPVMIFGKFEAPPIPSPKFINLEEIIPQRSPIDDLAQIAGDMSKVLTKI